MRSSFDEMHASATAVREHYRGYQRWLAEQPGDPLLEELLLKTYQDELAVLSNISQLTNSLANAPVNTPANMPTSPTGERMQL